MHYLAAQNYLLWHTHFNTTWNLTLKRHKPYKTPQQQSIKDLWLFFPNYLWSFIPDHSNKTTFLWAQITNWDWNTSTDLTFQQLKAWICNWLLYATLTSCNSEKPVNIQTNASKYSLVQLYQNNLPNIFAYKTLTDTKPGMQILKENFYPYAFSYLHIWQTCHCTEWS